MEQTLDGYLFSTSKERLDIPVIHQYLSNDSYWSKHIPLNVVEKAIEQSACFGVYQGDKQIAFARLITDYATFAYMADVFVLAGYQKKGIGKLLIKFMSDWMEPHKFRRIMLATLDAHQLYLQVGFTPLKQPERFMEISRPDVYGDEENVCQ